MSAEHRTLARAMRAEGKSFEEIGAALGISRQGAQYLCRGDGSAEVRVVLSKETLANLDPWGEINKLSRQSAVARILEIFFH